MTALSGISAGTCTVSQEEDNRSYTHPGSMSLTQLRAHSFLDGLSTWKTQDLWSSLSTEGICFAFMWCSSVRSIFMPFSYHSVTDLLQSLSCWGWGRGPSLPSYVLIRTAVRCSESWQVCKRIQLLSLTRCSEKGSWCRSGPGDRKPSVALLWMRG